MVMAVGVESDMVAGGDVRHVVCGVYRARGSKMRGFKLLDFFLLNLLAFASALNLHKYLQTGELSSLVLLSATITFFLVILVGVLEGRK